MKRPSFQFYPGDWLNDAALRMVSIGARGLWIDMLCLMHQGSDYGCLKVNHKVILPPNLARMVGATLPEVEGWLKELGEAGVFSIDEENCIFSRRMIRDEEVRKARAAGGFKGGNPKLLGKNKVTTKVDNKVNLQPNLRPTPSSSSSSSSSKDKPSSSSADDGSFDHFWSAYPRKTGKGSARTAWKKRKPVIELVLEALAWQKQSKAWLKDDGQFIPHPATWLNQERWLDEPDGMGVIGTKYDPNNPEHVADFFRRAGAT